MRKYLHKYIYLRKDTVRNAVQKFHKKIFQKKKNCRSKLFLKITKKKFAVEIFRTKYYSEIEFPKAKFLTKY